MCLFDSRVKTGVRSFVTTLLKYGAWCVERVCVDGGLGYCDED